MRFALVLSVLLVASCIGPAGPEGPVGPMGPAGPQGATGPTGLTVASTRVCIGNPDRPPDGGASPWGEITGMTYQVVRYLNGDVWVACSVLGKSTQTSTSAFYRASEVFAAMGTCRVVFNVSLDTTRLGYWTFEEGTPDAHAIYTNPSGGADGLTVLLTSCSRL